MSKLSSLLLDEYRRLCIEGIPFTTGRETINVFNGHKYPGQNGHGPGHGNGNGNGNGNGGDWPKIDTRPIIGNFTLFLYYMCVFFFSNILY